MGFDARSAKLLQPGQHIVVDDYPGLRLVASTKGRAWIYRYQVGDKTRQIKFGQWPAMSLGNAISRWQELKDARVIGADPVLERRAARKKRWVYTVAQVVDAYIDGHLGVNRKPAGAKATAARLRTAIEPIAHIDAAEVSRAVAFDLISGLVSTPVVAKSVKNELGAAWDLALDAGALAETPNWWRQILAGKLKSKGAVRDGVHKGTAKRTLSDAEIYTLFDVDMGRFSQQVQDFLVVQLWTCTRGG